MEQLTPTQEALAALISSSRSTMHALGECSKHEPESLLRRECGRAIVAIDLLCAALSQPAVGAQPLAGDSESAELAEWLKDGETVLGRLKREHKDVLTAMEMLAGERRLVEQLRAQLGDSAPTGAQPLPAQQEPPSDYLLGLMASESKRIADRLEDESTRSTSLFMSAAETIRQLLKFLPAQAGEPAGAQAGAEWVDKAIRLAVQANADAGDRLFKGNPYAELRAHLTTLAAIPEAKEPK